MLLRYLHIPGELLGVAFLLAEHAAAVFLHIQPQLTRLLLSLTEAGAEVAIQEGDAVPGGGSLGGLAQQVVVLVGADEQRAGEAVEPAGVIAMEPKVLVLDEPTAGLDPQGRDAILAQIQAYHRAKGAAVVLVSHSMEEIARNVDRIVVLSGGQVYMEGTPEKVFARAHELEQVGLDVPQVTKIAAALRARGMDIDTAVYTVEALERKLLTLKGGAGGC